MPPVLENNQWAIGEYVFGMGCEIDQDPVATPPGLALRTEDQAIPGMDGSMPGVDLFEPGVWKFQLWTNCEDRKEAKAALRRFAEVWRGDEYRQLPGRSTDLRFNLDGETRVVYGRPREFDYTIGPEALNGRIPITCNFKVMSEMYFDDSENSMTVTHKEPVGGDATWPLTWPVSWGTQAVQAVPFAFTVAGRLPTPAVVEFTGPLEGSGILIDGRPFIDFQSNIPGGVTVTVDARPWVTSVYRSDGAAVAGLLSPRSRMPRMLLSRGLHSARLLGTSSTGTGRAVIRWRPAYPSI